MTVNLSSQITRYGVSSAFSALFESLRETPGINEKKYRVEDVNKVAQYLVCRNYGKACLELSYLVWSVVNYPKESIANAPLLEFFWLDENITPARFRSAFSQDFQSTNNDYSITINEAGLQLNFTGKSSSHFVISPTRVGVLAVLLEFITTIDPQQLQVIEGGVKEHCSQNDSEEYLEQSSEKAIKSLSSSLQKFIYQYLSEHLIQAQQQRRFRYVTQWLDSQGDNDNSKANTVSKTVNKTSTNFLNDETLLSFWQQAAVDDSSPGFKLYSSALHDFIHVHSALQQAKDSLEIENSTTIGFDHEGGEYSPDVIQTVLFDGEHHDELSLDWLCASPKFLSKNQWAFIEPLILHNAHIKPLALSFLRLTIFGHWQSAIVQAKRKSQEKVADKLTEIPTFHYQIYQQQLVELNHNINQVVLAIIHIFYHLQDSRYLGLTLPYLSQAEQQKIQILVSNTIAGITNAREDDMADNKVLDEVNHKLFIKSREYFLQSVEFQQVMIKAKKAFTANNKDGFQKVPEHDASDIYQDGSDAMIKCQQAIQTLEKKLTQLWSHSSTCEENFSSDVSIFKNMFTQLYL